MCSSSSDRRHSPSSTPAPRKIVKKPSPTYARTPSDLELAEREWARVSRSNVPSKDWEDAYAERTEQWKPPPRARPAVIASETVWVPRAGTALGLIRKVDTMEILSEGSEPSSRQPSKRSSQHPSRSSSDRVGEAGPSGCKRQGRGMGQGKGKAKDNGKGKAEK
jgi:hypothetical protein